MLRVATASFSIAQNAVGTPMDEDSKLGIIKPLWDRMALEGSPAVFVFQSLPGFLCTEV
jgi:hypothetical protein